MPLLRVDNLRVRRAQTNDPAVLSGIDLAVGPGEVHAIIGPDTAGMSALCAALMGSSGYHVTGGTVRFLGDDVTDWPVDERAKAGMFLAFRRPHDIPGVSLSQLLRQAVSAHRGVEMSVLELRTAAMDTMKRLSMDPSFVDRYLDNGFSGSERQRNEIMQMALLEPELAILDGTDTSLDSVAASSLVDDIGRVREDQESLGIVLVTDQARLLDHLAPDRVHILIDGHIVTSGGIELAEQAERSGYQSFLQVEA